MTSNHGMQIFNAFAEVDNNSCFSVWFNDGIFQTSELKNRIEYTYEVINWPDSLGLKNCFICLIQCSALLVSEIALETWSAKDIFKLNVTLRTFIFGLLLIVTQFMVIEISP